MLLINKSIVVLAALAALAGHASAHIVTYVGTFSGLSEVPSNPSPGTGTAIIDVDDHTSTIRFRATFGGLIGTVSASHVHFGTGPGTNGGVATPLPSFPLFPLGVTSGTYDQTFDMTLASSYNPAFITANGGTTATAFSAFITRLSLGHGYWNIHSSFRPGGELRADMVAVPEPATMTALALGGLAMLRRRKKA